eukprot:3683060-Prymnesium_polylepis.1
MGDRHALDRLIHIHTEMRELEQVREENRTVSAVLSRLTRREPGGPDLAVRWDWIRGWAIS